MHRDELEGLLAIGERLFGEVSEHVNSVSSAHIRHDRLDYRRHIDMKEIFLSLALFALKRKLIPENVGECPMCGGLRKPVR
jgi:hypothetical protein